MEGGTMTNTPSPTDATTYLENLMRAGQDATKQFDDALALAMGVHGEEKLRRPSSFRSH
jgi:hypothetical protein